jgi:hypothetical protein
MRKASSALLVAVILLLAGCVTEKQVQSSEKEKLSGFESFDINNDNFTEYGYFIGQPNTIDGHGLNIQRIILTNSERSIGFPRFNNLSQDNASAMDVVFEEFVIDKQDSDDACNLKLGIAGYKCVDAKTCAKMCAEGNPQCAKLVAENGELIGRYMLQYIQDNNRIYPDIEYVRNALPKLNIASQERRKEVGNRINSIETNLASLNSNPLLRAELFGLCEPNRYNSKNLHSLLSTIGDYELEVKTNYYDVFLVIKAEKPENKLSYADLIISDTVPASLSATDLKSYQQIVVNNSAISWPAFKPYLSQSALLTYEFASPVLPTEALGDFNQPSITVKTLDLSFASPTLFIFDILRGISGSYYVALGASVAVLLGVVWAVLTLLVVGYHVAKAVSVKQSPYAGVMKAVGKTMVKWKNDLAFGVLLLIVGCAVAYIFAPPMKEPFNLFKTEELLTEPTAFFATLFVFAGLLFILSAVDNFLRRMVNERTYTQKFNEEKAAFQDRVLLLKSKLHDLGDLVETYGKQNFDVGMEYDLLTRISLQHIDELASAGDDRSRKLMDEYANQVDGAINGLNERRSVAEKNWSIWKNAIALALEEKNEVFASNLVSIPSTLRNWALSKYTIENSDAGLVFEGDMIKKKKITAEDVTANLLNKNLLLGAVVLKDGALAYSAMADGSGTVPSVLALKLIRYLKGLGNKMNIPDYDSVAVVGEKNVMALIRYRNVESVIFMQKEKFKDAIDDWKNKIKAF